MTSAPDGGERLAELAANLAAVRASIAAACEAAGRSAAEVTLIAVTKTFPASDVMLLHRLGIADIGENKDQEAAPKVAACAAAGLALRWHFVGQLQVNKAAQRGELRRHGALGGPGPAGRGPRPPGGRGRPRGRCLVQVSLGRRSGAAAAARDPDQVLALADGDRRRADGLALAGVMAVAPLGAAGAGLPTPGCGRSLSYVRSAHPGSAGDLGRHER